MLHTIAKTCIFRTPRRKSNEGRSTLSAAEMQSMETYNDLILLHATGCGIARFLCDSMAQFLFTEAR